jgi:hypothetical protein
MTCRSRRERAGVSAASVIEEGVGGTSIHYGWNRIPVPVLKNQLC